MSTGIGWDTHQLVEGRPLILGGVRLEHERGLAGHSDADVLTHAVIDAMLGAAGLGDIGQHYPDTDPRYKGIDSMHLLASTVTLLAESSLRVAHVNVKATRGEGMGFIGRAEGVAALAVVTVEPL